MKRTAMSISFALIAFLSSAQAPQIKQVSSAEFSQLVKNAGGVLLDVRTLSEFRNGHIANSGQLNFYALDFGKRLLMLPKDEPIYLYCNTGWRSEKAAKTLAENGYKNVYNLEHGIMDWELQNLPVVVDPDAKPDTQNKIEYEELARLIESGKPVFIDFYAPWCGPCRQMMPMIDELKAKYYGKINVVKVNVDASKKLVKEMKIKGVPYLALFNNGKVIAESNDIVNVEGNAYFPFESVKKEFLNESDTQTVCHWKGTASYYNLKVDGKEKPDAAWHYPTPSGLASSIRGRVAFWKGVQIVKD